MDYAPPGRVVRVCDPRWSRWIIKDGSGKYWAGENQWRDEPSEATLFCREIDAMEARNRHCLGDVADTFTATVVVTVHAGRWTVEELADHLSRHRKFCAGGSPGKGGLLLEILPGTLRRPEP
jgi:hypothetical protein